MGIIAVKQKGEEVARILRENGHMDCESDLQAQIKELESNPVDALNDILGQCNIRALGDLSIKTMPSKEWSTHIIKLDQKSRRALRRLIQGEA